MLNNIRKLINEIKGIEYHKVLNPKLWNNFILKKEVRDKLLEIADLFIGFLDVDLDKHDISDIVFTGSSANFNYTEYSDIDLHIIVDYDRIHKNCPIVGEFLDAKKSLFNKKHELSLFGHPVEVYVEDLDNPATSSGVYSILNNEWVTKPTYMDIKIDDRSVQAKYKHLKSLIRNILKDKESLEDAQELLSKIYDMRRSSLKKHGEFSTENLVFKLLRNEKYLKKLKEFIMNVQDREMSI